MNVPTQPTDDTATRLTVETVAIVSLAVVSLLVGIDLGYGIGIPRALAAFVFFAVGPGTLLLTLCGFGPRAEARWLIYAVGTSLLSVMAVGLLLSLVGPVVGLDRPLSARALGAAHTSLAVGLAAAISRVDPPGRTIGLPNREWWTDWLGRWVDPPTLALVLLPLTTILSVAWLNRTGDNRPLIGVLVVIALVPMGIALGWLDRRRLPLAVGAVGLSLLYHDSLWQYSDFSGQANIVEAWQTGRWAITARSVEGAATTPLLPNVTLSPTFAHLSGVDIFVQIEVFNPLVVAVIPLASFVLFRRLVDAELAALGAILVTFIHPFYYQLPAGGRAAMPVVFLVVACVTLTDAELQSVLRQGLALGFVAALVTAHYGASYFVMAGFVIALTLLVGLRLLDGIVAAQSIDGDGSRRDRLRAAFTQRSYAFSAAFVAFYVVLSLAWYRYTFGGQKLTAFLTRVRTALVSLLQSGAGGGGSAARLTREYGADSIQLSRSLYVLLAALSALGVCYLLAERFVDADWRHREGVDEFFVLGVGLLAVFSLTFVLQSVWGGGRPMAIAFSVTALFAVLGVVALVDIPARCWRRLGGRNLGGPSTARIAGVLFAALLATLLVLNTGVAAATVLGGTAPSTVPLQPAIEQRAADDPGAHATVHFEQDVSMLIWLTSHADGETDAFVDGITQQRANDIYEPQIAAGVPPDSQRSITWTPNLFAAVDHRDPAYVVLPSYSVNLGVAEPPDGPQYTGARRYRDISTVEQRLADEHKIYTNGDTEIYRLDGE